MVSYFDTQHFHLSQCEYFGGKEGDTAFEDLYRTPDGTWLRHVRHFGTPEPARLEKLAEDSAISWLLDSVQARVLDSDTTHKMRPRSSVPDWIVPREEYFRCGSIHLSGPPPLGTMVELIPPVGSPTLASINERCAQVLTPGRVLQHLMWPSPVEADFTIRFRDERHDEMLSRLLMRLEGTLLENPRIYVTQSLQDRGCDLVIDWPLREKFGVQLKSNDDVSDSLFSKTTVAQIQDSRQHSLSKLYLVLAADMTQKSNREKICQLMSRISTMNDPYVVVVPPERAFGLVSK